MEKFDRIFTKACDCLALYVCGSIALIMILYVSVHVCSRYVFGTGGVVGTYSFVGALFVPLIYLGLSYAWYKRGYIVVDAVQVRLKGRVLWGFQFAFLLVTLLLFVVWMVYGAFLATTYSYLHEVRIGEVEVFTTPRWPWQATIVIGMLLMAIRNILDLVRMVRTGEVIPIDR